MFRFGLWAIINNSVKSIFAPNPLPRALIGSLAYILTQMGDYWIKRRSFYRAVLRYYSISFQKCASSVWKCPSWQILASIRYLNYNNKYLCSFHSEKWKLIVALMGFSLITSEAENFLIWLLSICNLSFVDFLFIPSSLSTSVRHSVKLCRSICWPDPARGPWWTWSGRHSQGLSTPGVTYSPAEDLWTAGDKCYEEATTHNSF